MLEIGAMTCLALAWLVPNHYPPWNSFYNETASAVGLLLLVIAIIRRSSIGIFPTSAIAILLVAAVPWAQLVFGLLRFSGDAWVASLYLCGFAIAIAAGNWWSAEDRRRHAEMLAWTMWLPALVSASIALCQGLQVNAMGIWTLDAVPGMRAYANLAQPNNLATLLGFGAVGLLLLVEKSRLGTFASATALFPLLLALALTQSRTALLFGPLVWVAVVWGKRKCLITKVRPAAVGLITLLHWVMVWNWPLLQKSLLLTTQLSLAERSTGSLRFRIWPMLLDAVSLSPWHGYGWLQVGEAELAVAERHPVAEELWLHGHNVFLELVVWCGYPLGLLLCAAIVYWMINRMKGINDKEGLVAACIIGVFGLHCLFELPHHYAYFLIPVGLWAGFMEPADKTSKLRLKVESLLPIGLSLLLMIALWKDYPAVEEDFRLMRFEALHIGSIKAKEPAPEAPFLSTLTAFLRNSRTVPRQGMTSDELERMAAVTKRYPYAAVLFRYAVALALNGRGDEAALMLVKLRHIYGDAVYAPYGRMLYERVEAGESSLAALAATWSPR